MKNETAPFPSHTSAETQRPLFLSLLDFLQKDARHFQILYLGAFLLYGVFALDWEADLPKIGLTIATCLVVQWIGAKVTRKKHTGLKSAMITALGLCLLFKANALWAVALAAGLSIGGKFLIRAKGKHVFNPANFGIILTILLTPDGWISPGQWGHEVIMVYFFAAAALIVLLKVGRIDTSLAFLLTFGGLQFARDILYLGWPLDHWTHLMTNGSLLLFTFFMITDPVTTPNAPRSRILWAVMVGLLAFILTDYFYVQTALLWALFIISPITVLLDRYFIHPTFNWKKP